MIILVYVDECILVSPSSAVIKTLLRVWQIDQRSLHSQMFNFVECDVCILLIRLLMMPCFVMSFAAILLFSHISFDFVFCHLSY